MAEDNHKKTPTRDADAMVDAMVRKLTADGATAAEDGQFTVDREKARAKMREFMLAEPRAYVLEFAQAAVLKGASAVLFEIDTNDVIMKFSGRPFTLAEFDMIYNVMFGGRRDPDTEALRELAVGINAALALTPKTIRVTSGDGSEGARLEVRPGRQDRFEPIEKKVPAETVVHVRYGLSLGSLERWSKSIDQKLPEEEILRKGCRFSRVPMRLEGEPLSWGFNLRHALSIVKFKAEGLSGVAAYINRKYAEHRARLYFVKNGVIITSIRLPDQPSNAVAVVEGDALIKDLSQGDIVRNEAFEAARKAAEKALDPQTGLRLIDRG
jgi:hypothetical protein